MRSRATVRRAGGGVLAVGMTVAAATAALAAGGSQGVALAVAPGGAVAVPTAGAQGFFAALAPLGRDTLALQDSLAVGNGLAVQALGPTGAPDRSFAASGELRLRAPAGDSWVAGSGAVAATPGGGFETSAAVNEHGHAVVVLERLDARGRRVAAFGAQGLVTLTVASIVSAVNTRVVIDRAGETFLAVSGEPQGGQQDGAPVSDVVIAALGPSGASVASFGTAGILDTGDDIELDALALQPGPNLLIAGEFQSINDAMASDTPSPELYRYGATGALERFTLMSSLDGWIEALAVAPSGAVYGTGVLDAKPGQSGPGMRLLVVRFSASGQVDRSFGRRGFVALAVDRDPTDDDEGDAVTVLPDADVLAAGEASAYARMVVVGSDQIGETKHAPDRLLVAVLAPSGVERDLTTVGPLGAYARAVLTWPDGGALLAGGLGPAQPCLDVCPTHAGELIRLPAGPS